MVEKLVKNTDEIISVKPTWSKTSLSTNFDHFLDQYRVFRKRHCPAMRMYSIYSINEFCTLFKLIKFVRENRGKKIISSSSSPSPSPCFSFFLLLLILLFLPSPSLFYFPSRIYMPTYIKTNSKCFKFEYFAKIFRPPNKSD